MNEIIIETQSGPDINVDTAGRIYLNEAAKWAKFLAIVSFIMIGFIVVLAFFMGSIMAAIAASSGAAAAGSAISGGVMTAIYLISAAITFIPTWMLFLFAVKTKAALVDSTISINNGFRQLKNYFLFNAVMTIIMLVFVAITLLIVIVAGIAAI